MKNIEFFPNKVLNNLKNSQITPLNNLETNKVNSLNTNNASLNNTSEEIIILKAILLNTIEEFKQLSKGIKRKTFFSWLFYYVFYSLLKNFTANFFRVNEIDLYSLFINLITKLGGKQSA